jgi:hypothetical protein
MNGSQLRFDADEDAMSETLKLAGFEVTDRGWVHVTADRSPQTQQPIH